MIKHVQGTAHTRYSGQRTIETQQSGGLYRLRDYSRGNGIETYNMNRGTNFSNATDFTDNNNIWTVAEFHNSNKDDAALDAHWGAEMTYDYFLQKHNRDSYDGNGGKLKNYVHANLVGLGYQNNDNAFWDPTYERMVYGDGQYSFDALTSIDVIAHEIGHGVCSFTANLVYQNESGAINEGLSDIWGAMVEYFAEPTKQTYEIAEDIKLGGGSLRSMSNPNSRNQPDTYLGDYWYTASSDNGGVHTNSGILNYWFYLLAEGGSDTNDIGNYFDINGIGKEKAAKIVYRAESIYFTSTTTYNQARLLTIQAAEDLFGENSVESATTCQSWYAVGVGNNNCSINIELTGNSTICNTSNYTYTLDNLPPNSNTSWSITSNIQIINSSNSTITIKPINSTINGWATITATVNGTMTITKDIWIGKPKIKIAKLSDSSLLSHGSINYVCKQLNVTTNMRFENANSVSWSLINSSRVVTWSQQGNNLSFYLWAINHTATFRLTLTNECGTFIQDYDFKIKNCNSNSNPCDPNVDIDNNTIVIDYPCLINGITSSENNNINIFVFDFNGRLIKKVKSNFLDITNLKRGIYILKIKLKNGKILTKKIIK